MEFVIYEDTESGNLWITTPEHEQETLKEMSECKVTEFDRMVAHPKNALLIEPSVRLKVVD